MVPPGPLGRCTTVPPQHRGRRAVHRNPEAVTKNTRRTESGVTRTHGRSGPLAWVGIPPPPASRTRAPGSPRAGRTFADGFPSCFPGSRRSPCCSGGRSQARLHPSSRSSLCLSSRVSAQCPSLSMRNPVPSPPLSPPPPIPLPASLLLRPFIKQTRDPETWTLCRRQCEEEAEAKAERRMGAEGDL